MEKLCYYIEKYYKAKNEEYKNIIKEFCKKKTTIGGASISTGFTAVSAFSSEAEIKNEIKEKLACSEEINSERFGLFDQYNGKHVIRFCKDIQKFHALFLSKGIEATYKKIFTAFNDIIDKEECEIRQKEIFETINNEVTNKGSVREITRKFLEYILATNKNVSLSEYSIKLLRIILEEACKIDLPPLLKKFGLQYDHYTDDLSKLCNEMIELMKKENTRKKEQELEAFESNLDSNYDDLPTEDIPKDFSDKYDDQLLSDYLAEDDENIGDDVKNN